MAMYDLSALCTSRMYLRGGGEERGDGEDERREGIGRGEDRGEVMGERRKDCVKGGEEREKE